MTKKLKIVLAQLDFVVGDIKGNIEKHIVAANRAKSEFNADVIVFPELSITGYSPEDMLLRPEFSKQAAAALQTLTSAVNDIHMLVGHPDQQADGLKNACSVIYNGRIIATYAKQYLPNYRVFDEARYFTKGNETCIININDIPIGIIICEDIWEDTPIVDAAKAGAQIILCPNASTYSIDKHDTRFKMLSPKAIKNHVDIVYVNVVNGQDDIIFDGGSMAVDHHGKLTALAGFFKEQLLPVEIEIEPEKEASLTSKAFDSLANLGAHIKDVLHFADNNKVPSKIEGIYQALVFALREYIDKNKFPGVIIGLSGGIDSALTTALAVDALGKDRVQTIGLPSRYTSQMSNDDAETLANKLGIQFDIISIETAYKAFLSTLTPDYITQENDATHQNIQARCRAIILMALSNQSGKLVLSTGNRSEIAVGYCTLYGDMAGGFAPLKDVPKTLVYELSRYRNSISPVIPERIITRAPSAELAPDQTDQDSLPPYDVLDKILYAYMNESKSVDDIVADGFDRDMVTKVVKLICANEYKRKQATIGPRINQKSFGKDWRYPVTNYYKG